jgi:Ca2+-binding EF-hand superfamily protein
MPSRKLLITASVLALAVGATAALAQGFGGGTDGWSGERGSMGWRQRWWGGQHDSIKKSEFDEQTRARFARIDANNDKVIDADEAKALITSRMARRDHGRRHERQERRLERLMQRFDLNHDKKIERAEFDKQIAFFFDRMDLDGDGKITDQDLPPIMRGMGVLKGHFRGHGMRHNRGPGRILALLRGADTNNDGEITRAEAEQAAGRFFARFDRNNDGVIEKADLEVLKNEMIAYRVKRFFHRYGGTKDGKLTLEQYTAARDRWFARWDANGDQVLSEDEMPRRFKRHWWRHAWNDDRGRGEWRERRGWRQDRMREREPEWNDRRPDDETDREAPPHHERQL